MMHALLWRFALTGLFFGPSLSVYAQSASTEQQASEETSFREGVNSLASQILQHSGKVHCLPGECTVLVTNFVLPGGETSDFGIRLAGALSVQLSEGLKPFRMVDRSALQSFLKREHLSPRTQGEEPAAQWLARRLGAGAVIIGKTIPAENGRVEVATVFLSATEEKRKSGKLKTRVIIDPSATELSPSNEQPLKPSEDHSLDEAYFAGVKGVSLPGCYFMPNPSYTQDARHAHYSGTVVLEAVVELNGRVKPRRILKGAPFDLNDSAITTLATWKCHPAELNGKPVPVIVPFEVNFRIW